MKSKIEKILDKSYPGAKAHVHKDRFTGNYHVFVVSKKFTDGYNQEAADTLWSVLQENLKPAQLIKITLAMAVSPDDFQSFMSMGSSAAKR